MTLKVLLPAEVFLETDTEKIVAEAETLGDPSLTARALLALARAQAVTGADEPASASAAKAVWQAIADRDDETRGEPLDIPFERTGQGFVEVVDVEHQPAFGRRVCTEVGEVRVATELRVQPRRRRPIEVGGHHQRRASIERER